MTDKITANLPNDAKGSDTDIEPKALAGWLKINMRDIIKAIVKPPEEIRNGLIINDSNNDFFKEIRSMVRVITISGKK